MLKTKLLNLIHRRKEIDELLLQRLTDDFEYVLWSLKSLIKPQPHSEESERLMLNVAKEKLKQISSLLERVEKLNIQARMSVYKGHAFEKDIEDNER